jgi:hypothetical protein
MLHQTTGGDPVWINYSDAPDGSGRDLEGFWRHRVWIDWGAGEPNNVGGNEDCAGIGYDYVQNRWEVLDLNCANASFVLCRMDQGAYAGAYDVAGADSWWEAEKNCTTFGDGGRKFTYPYCPAEYAEVLDVLWQGSPTWIRLNDSDSEGYWVSSK